MKQQLLKIHYVYLTALSTVCLNLETVKIGQVCLKKNVYRSVISTSTENSETSQKSLRCQKYIKKNNKPTILHFQATHSG